MDFALAATSGVLLALSFPRYGHPACAWVALVPLLVALSGWSGRPTGLAGTSAWRGWRLGFVTGLVYFVGTVYWTSTVLATFGGLPLPLALFAMVLLASFLATYLACAAAVLGRCFAAWGRGAFALAPVLWIASEYLRGTLFGGFPWVPLGNSQVEVLPVAQLASLVGVYGLSGFVAGINAAVAHALTGDSRVRMRSLAAVALTLIVAAGWGSWRVGNSALTRAGEPLRVGLIQGNIEQRDKWAPGQARRIFTTYLAMTRDAVRRGAEYVIWPESSTPFMFEEDAVGAAAIRGLSAEVGVPILFGSDQIVRGGPPRLYNAAFLVTPARETRAVYRKMQLVPFGEFIPLQQWLTFVSPLVDSVGQFSAGESVVMLPVGAHKTSTAICYEVVFPWLIRQAVVAGSELLTTITNDAWYGQSSAPYQHFALASMRAIEQGRYLARAANTGISGVVDPYGRVVQASTLFTEASVVADVRLLTARTIYSRIGDVVAYASVALALGLLVALRRR
jgi:apolipoprotein N-acyltransferase